MKRYRLTENRLRGMIREAVKGVLDEAHGTLSQADYDYVHRLDEPNFWDKDGAGTYNYSKADSFNPVANMLNLVNMAKGSIDIIEDDTYRQKLSAHLESASNILKRLIGKEKMKMGVQPDRHYRDIHSKFSYPTVNTTHTSGRNYINGRGRGND